MPIRQSIAGQPAKPALPTRSADDPALIRRMGELLKDNECEIAARELMTCPDMVKRVQTMADHGNLAAKETILIYRWTKFGINPITGEELGPQTGPFPKVQ